MKPNEEEQKEIDSLVDEIHKLGHDIHLPEMVVLIPAGGGRDMIVGEVAATNEGYAPLSGRTVWVKNPKRYVRVEMLNPMGSLVLSYMIGNFDHVDQGLMDVTPVAGYWLGATSAKSQIEVLKLYKAMAERERGHTVSGRIAIPNGPLPPMR